MQPTFAAPKQSRNPLRKVGAWFERHKKIVIISALVSFVTTFGLLAYAITHQKPVVEPKRVQVAAPAPQTPRFYSPLTGNEVADEAATKRQVTGVMIENSPDARPQSGVKDAGVVYEAIAEGGITRFLCLYQESRPGLIGPVRSVRPYYVDWIASYDAAVAHIGGSKKALDEVRNGQYKDIDQFFNAAAYYRASDRYAPHNVYTTFDRLDALNQKKGFTSSTFNGFARKKDEPSKSPNAQSIAVTISSGSYNSSYTYDAASNGYKRSQAGKSHDDRESGQVTPKVVVVMEVPTSLGMEDGLREQMQTIGSGKAYVFQDGIASIGTWSKPDKKTGISFKTESGAELKLNAGQTWLTAVAPGKVVTWQ